MTEPAVSLSYLGGAAESLLAWEERRDYYAASTVKLAVAAAYMLAVERGTFSPEQTVVTREHFASRVEGTPMFAFPTEEVDPGMPSPGTPVTLAWCLARMLTVSSNEATNIIVEVLGGGGPESGVRGLALVADACEMLGVPGVRMQRLICDSAARDEGFSHTASAADLAKLMWQMLNADVLQVESRANLLARLRAQEFPIIAATLPPTVCWASKSGWDHGIRHDVAALGEPGSAEFRVLAICTEGYSPTGAQELIKALADATLNRGSAEASMQIRK